MIVKNNIQHKMCELLYLTIRLKNDKDLASAAD